MRKNFLIFKILLMTCLITITEARSQFYVGAIFENEIADNEIAFRTAIERSNVEHGNDDRNKFKLASIIIYSGENPSSYTLQSIVCNLTSQGVIAIFGSNAPRSGIISAICHELGIPHFIFDYEKELRIFEREFYSMSISVYPNDMVLAKAYAAVIQSFHWDRLAIIYETDRDLAQLQDVLQIPDPNSKPTIIRQMDPEDDDLRPILKEIREMNYHYLIIHCSVEKILPILKQANELNMMGEYQSIFLASLDTPTIDFNHTGFVFKANITTMRLFDPNDYNVQNIVIEWHKRGKSFGKYISVSPSRVKTKMLLANDAVSIFAKGLSDMNIVNKLHLPRLDCHKAKSWHDGRKIIEFIKEKSATKQEEFTTGPIDFDQYGQRSHFNVYVVEVTPEGYEQIATWDPANGIKTMDDNINEKRREEKFQNKLFIVSSRIGQPYLFNRSEYITNETLKGNNCFEGYSMDLIDALAERIGFKYEFRIARDGKYGALDKKTGKWNGIMREVIEGNADLGICDLTMTSTRRQAVDFTPPFMTLGISLLYSQPEEATSNLWSFKNPFEKEVWLWMGVASFGIVVLVFFAARMAPSDWENPHPCEKDPDEVENVWNKKNTVWLTIGSLMGQGCDLLPKAFSTRVITGLWWFFALMMLNSYTANLAAFLTKSSSSNTIKSVEDLANQKDVKYGTHFDGSTMGFFRDSNDSLYSKMWSFMVEQEPSVFTNNNDEGEERVVKSKRKYAYFIESTGLEYKTERNCDLLQIGQWLDFKTYGIAMPFNSPYRKRLSEEMLKLGESGVLADLKRRWWKEKFINKTCDKPPDQSGPSRLKIENVGGVFLVLGLGLVIAHIIGWIEFFWNVQKVAVEEKVSMMEALKAELLFASKVWIATKPVNISSNSMTSSRQGSKSSLSTATKETKTIHGSEFSLKNIIARHDGNDVKNFDKTRERKQSYPHTNLP